MPVGLVTPHGAGASRRPYLDPPRRLGARERRCASPSRLASGRSSRLPRGVSFRPALWGQVSTGLDSRSPPGGYASLRPSPELNARGGIGTPPKWVLRKVSTCRATGVRSTSSGALEPRRSTRDAASLHRDRSSRARNRPGDPACRNEPDRVSRGTRDDLKPLVEENGVSSPSGGESGARPGVCPDLIAA